MRSRLSERRHASRRSSTRKSLDHVRRVNRASNHGVQHENRCQGRNACLAGQRRPHRRRSRLAAGVVVSPAPPTSRSATTAIRTANSIELQIEPTPGIARASSHASSTPPVARWMEETNLRVIRELTACRRQSRALDSDDAAVSITHRQRTLRRRPSRPQRQASRPPSNAQPLPSRCQLAAETPTVAVNSASRSGFTASR